MRYKIEDQNGLYFLTMTIVEWIDLFTRPVYKDIVIESLKYCQKEKGLVVSAYVIMPSHLHLILNTNNKKQYFKTPSMNFFIKDYYYMIASQSRHHISRIIPNIFHHRNF